MSLLIAIIPANSAGVYDDSARQWIIGNPDESLREDSHVSGERIEHGQSFQTITGSDWEEAQFVDRNNCSVTRTFSGTKQFADKAAAFRWAASFASVNRASWPHKTEGKFILRFLLGDGTFEEWITSVGVLNRPAINNLGKTLNLSYTARYGSNAFYRTAESVEVEAVVPTAPSLLWNDTQVAEMEDTDVIQVFTYIGGTLVPRMTVSYTVTAGSSGDIADIIAALQASTNASHYTFGNSAGGLTIVSKYGGSAIEIESTVTDEIPQDDTGLDSGSAQTVQALVQSGGVTTTINGDLST
jgi:hypothetical protein